MATATKTAEATFEELQAQAPEHVTIPPKDIRPTVERVAQFVATKGSMFEDRLRADKGTFGQYSFLGKDDVYHSYYQWRLEEWAAGRVKPRDGTTVNTGVAANKQAPKGPVAPPEYRFSARMPNISAQDLDIIKLTALYVAKNGQAFATALSQREATNYQFDFLRTQHSLNQFFKHIVHQYTELIDLRHRDNGKAQAMRVKDLTDNISQKFSIIDRAKERAEYQKHQAKQKQQKEDAEEAEKIAFAQIDWGNFAVAATIEFTPEDEEMQYPPPKSLNDLQTSSLEQKAAAIISSDRRIEYGGGAGMHDYYSNGNAYAQPPPQYPYPPQQPSFNLPPRPGVSPVNYPQQQQQQLPPPPPPTFSPQPAAGPIYSPPPPPSQVQTPASSDPAAAARRSANAPMNIRTDYVPRAQAARRAQHTQICPNCKQQIPTDEMEEHLRIELLDPRWKEQRAKNEAKYATTNLSTADVANNLKRLASQRSDVFDGVSSESISEEELLRRKRAATQYDGFIVGSGGDRSTGRGGGAHKDSAGAADPAARLQQQQQQQMMGGGAAGGAAGGGGGANIEEQLRRIREKNQG